MKAPTDRRPPDRLQEVGQLIVAGKAARRTAGPHHHLAGRPRRLQRHHAAIITSCVAASAVRRVLAPSRQDELQGMESQQVVLEVSDHPLPLGTLQTPDRRQVGLRLADQPLDGPPPRLRISLQSGAFLRRAATLGRRPHRELEIHCDVMHTTRRSLRRRSTVHTTRRHVPRPTGRIHPTSSAAPFGARAAPTKDTRGHRRATDLAQDA